MIIKKQTNKFFGFTLAEVLITLGIIGVVAAMTIPTLLTNTKDTEYKTAYKKAYNVLSNAFMTAKANGDIGTLTGTYSQVGMDDNFAAIQNQYKVAKACADAGADGCWDTNGDQWRSENYAAPGFIDTSGMAWKLRDVQTSGKAPAVLVDTNGLKGPNKYGKDRFPFFLNSSAPGDAWTNISTGVTIGMPTRISPLSDIAKGTTDGGERLLCPSYVSNSCDNTSWLLGN